MSFEKGRKKTGGRGRGVQNKATLLLEDRRDEAYKLVDGVMKFLKTELESEDEKRILKAIDKLPPILPFILPKLSNIEAQMSGDTGIRTFIFENANPNKD